MNGMLASEGFRFIADGIFIRLDIAGEVEVYEPTESDGRMLPDLDDPATLGFLLVLVRVAWGDETLCVQRDGDYVWRVKTCMEPRVRAHALTEAAALVAALEAAR
jgi:hypothetical protein